MTTLRFADSDTELDDLYGDLADTDLQPLWRLSEVLTPEPKASTQPFRWRGERLRWLAERAGKLIGSELGGDRRVLSCSNPGLSGKPYATPTLWAGVQYLAARESAPAHRHTPAALRLVLEGQGVWTTVNGDPIHMSNGDLILTPSWTFHGHHNPTDTPMMWLDVLDVPLVGYLESVFFEPPVESAWPKDSPALPPYSASELRWGSGAGLVPSTHDLPAPPARYSPLLHYRWSVTDEALRHLAETVDHDVRLRFTDPAHGTDPMPTMRCEIQRVAPHHATTSHRQTGSRVGAVLNGTGSVSIGHEVFDIEPGDIFVVPSWAWYELTASGTADLDVFTVSDAPVLEAVRLFREEWAAK